MAFGDLKKEAGIKSLDQLLADKSYIEGYLPTQADVTTFTNVGKAPSAEKFPHAARWYRHISSYSAQERSKFGGSKSQNGTASAKPADDDDIDLFGSDDEVDEEAEKAREERLKAYQDKKSKKPTVIAKSSVILDVKPWDDETDMAELEKCVRSVVMDGLVWGVSKLVPLAFGIKKLQIVCVVEDEKVSIDELSEKIQEFEDFVQSVDVAAFQKI